MIKYTKVGEFMRFKDLRGAILSLLLLIMDIALIINGLILSSLTSSEVSI